MCRWTKVRSLVTSGCARIRWRFTLLTLVCALPFGCRGDRQSAPQPPPTKTDLVDRLSPGEPNLELPLIAGAELYAAYCGACHGAEGKGDGPVAGNLKKETPDLTTLSRRSGNAFPRERVERYIRNEAGPESHGTPAMPLWGPIFTKTTRLDAQTRDKLQVLIDSEVTSPFLADLRMTNLIEHIESLQR